MADWNADRVLDKLAGIYDEMINQHVVCIHGEAGTVLDVMRDTFPEPDQRALLDYTRRKVVYGRPAALDDRTAKTLAGIVAMQLNRDERV